MFKKSNKRVYRASEWHVYNIRDPDCANRVHFASRNTDLYSTNVKVSPAERYQSIITESRLFCQTTFVVLSTLRIALPPPLINASFSDIALLLSTQFTSPVSYLIRFRRFHHGRKVANAPRVKLSQPPKKSHSSKKVAPE